MDYISIEVTPPTFFQLMEYLMENRIDAKYLKI